MSPYFSKTLDRDTVFPRVWAGFAIALLIATWPLWFPTIAANEYPAIPLAPFVIKPAIAELPWLLDGISLWTFAAMGSTICGHTTSTRSRISWFCVVAGLLASFAVDQHRLQPWAYQLAIYAIMFATLNKRWLRRLIIPAAASVYIYSALGKFDFQFAHTVGQEFWNVAARPLGRVAETLDDSMRARFALLFPAAELAAGIGLLFRRTRRGAGILVMGMHASLIVLLGPWGLDHSLGVLVWNLALMFQTYWWMVRSVGDSVVRSSVDSSSDASTPLPMATAMVLALMLIAPIGERWGLWDHWLSWSLYSPHTSRVDMQVHASAIAKLDETTAGYFDADDDGDGWSSFAMSRWSLEQRLVPVYPQARYQLAMAIAMADRHHWDTDIRVRVESVSDRWTGRRVETMAVGIDAIGRLRRPFWLLGSK
ncbi:hypothetical protein Poly51_27820 [Rubripirellula tenax]|uniref:Vitamin K-dependent gamma-carboxylase n=1 Tax=Rubripirellula tenax TaxID=2528015 RepID=A0A5C6F8R4_9BACT|nr:hypothetical protein [Rubripirellula tenax]TWU56864.1 hypothetical protein Poly51_27820 [Rubripirellula tenax]